MPSALLDDRGVLAVHGPEAAAFLAGIVTSAVDRLAPGEARFSALLTPQGKVLADFIAVATTDGFLLDVAAERLETLANALKRYRLRSKVEIADRSADLSVLAVWGDGLTPPEAVADPRLLGMGARAWLPSADAAARADTEAAVYHSGRIDLGLPEGGKDYLYGETFPHEANLDLLGGVDFDKGCYVGQEVVSRMQHRGTARSRVVPVRLEGEAPEPFAPVTVGERTIGSMGSSGEGRGMALLRLDRVADAAGAGQPIACGSTKLTVIQPSWAPFAIAGAVPA
jgi:folate-binding protein YgfZ